MRQPCNQVGIDGADTHPPHPLNVPKSNFSCVETSRNRRFPIDERLDAKADSVHATLDHGVKEMIVKRDIYRGDSWAIYRDRVSSANHRAISRYNPKNYDGHLALFLAAARQVGAKHDPRLEWGHRAVDGYAVFRVFAPDSGLLLKSPHVEVLAEQLKACLEQARSESEQPGTA